MSVTWTPQKAYHHFIDFNNSSRPKISCICMQTGVVGYALRYLESPENRTVVMHLGFDDKVVVRLNDDIVFHGMHEHGFAEVTSLVQLRKGRNRIMIKLSNTQNTNWRFWGFSCHFKEYNSLNT